MGNQRSLTDEDLKKYAEQVGLDIEAFNACLTSGQAASAVQTDYVEGQKIGVTGTPAFFINGRFLSGAQPFEQFKSIIDEELDRG